MYYMNFRWIINPLNASVGLIIPPSLPPNPTAANSYIKYDIKYAEGCRFIHI